MLPKLVKEFECWLCYIWFQQSRQVITRNTMLILYETPLGLNKYSLHMGLPVQGSYTDTPGTLAGMGAQPQPHGQWEAKFLKERMKEELKGNKKGNDRIRGK